MSLIPLIFDDILRPSRLMDQHFGLGLTPEDMFAPITIPDTRLYLRSPSSLYCRPWRSRASVQDTGSTVSVDKDKFQVNLDVQQFAPEEISVKVTDDNVITIEAKHEEKQDEHGYISRHFVRRYMVPKEHDMSRIESKLSSDGVLSIVAPKKDMKEEGCRSIPITQTGKPSKAVEDKSEKKQG